MMSRSIRSFLMAALLASAAESLGAQSVVIGGGVTNPVSTFRQSYKTGWMLSVGLATSLSKPGLWGGVEGIFGSHYHKQITEYKVNVPSALVNVGYRFGRQGRPGIFVYGTAGLIDRQVRAYTIDQNGDAWRFGYGGGAGVSIPAAQASVLLQVRYLKRGSVSIIPVTFGLALPLKS